MRGATRFDKLSDAVEYRFQSTLLMRGATPVCRFCYANRRHFNPRSSCEERPDSWPAARPCREFQSTLLMRGATLTRLMTVSDNKISIHAPHARSDYATRCRRGKQTKFQSTLLMRGATVSILGIDLPDFIIYFSRTYPFSPKMPTSRHLSCKLHFLCDGTSHFGDL